MYSEFRDYLFPYQQRKMGYILARFYEVIKMKGFSQRGREKIEDLRHQICAESFFLELFLSFFTLDKKREF